VACRPGAEDAASFGDVVAGRAEGAARGGVFGGGQVLGQAPVDDDGLAEVADDDVGGLEVAVDDVVVVRVGHGIGHGDHVVEEADALRDGRSVGDELAQRTAGDELHRVERRAVGPATGFVNGDDAGMLEARGDQGFAQEARFVDVAMRKQLLDGHVASELAVVSARDAAEAAAAVLRDDLVAVGVAELGGGNGARSRLLCGAGLRCWAGCAGVRGVGGRQEVRRLGRREVWGTIGLHGGGQHRGARIAVATRGPGVWWDGDSGFQVYRGAP
jgi:hypothetical protein